MLNSILLVEDDAAMNYLSRLVLNDTKAAQTIDVAYNGDEALALIKGGLHPDLIFLDIRMPLMDGFEFLEAFDALDNYDATKVAMLTSSLRPEDRTRALQHQCVIDFLEKPLTEEAAARLIRHCEAPQS